ncbi:DNA-binding protein [Paraburkholderia sp. BR14263]|uniref:DNA-binding protein n=1 Tax=unclassified Paraburkholderia TaxID=2615204 RepID=UPI0034CDD2EB
MQATDKKEEFESVSPSEKCADGGNTFQGASVPTRELLSASQIATLRLPGLPATKARIIERATSEGWYFEERKGVGGTRRMYQVPEEYFDQESGRPVSKRPVVLNEIASQKVRRLLRKTDMGDAEIVEAIALGVKNWIRNNRLEVSDEREAALIALLFSYFREEGGLSREKLEDMLRKVG